MNIVLLLVYTLFTTRNKKKDNEENQGYLVLFSIAAFINSGEWQKNTNKTSAKYWLTDWQSENIKDWGMKWRMYYIYFFSLFLFSLFVTACVSFYLSMILIADLTSYVEWKQSYYTRIHETKHNRVLLEYFCTNHNFATAPNSYNEHIELKTAHYFQCPLHRWNLISCNWSIFNIYAKLYYLYQSIIVLFRFGSGLRTNISTIQANSELYLSQLW